MYTFEVEAFDYEQYEIQQLGREVLMSLGKAIRGRRESARDRRELQRAIANAGSPALRDELILAAQRAEQPVTLR